MNSHKYLKLVKLVDAAKAAKAAVDEAAWQLLLARQISDAAPAASFMSALKVVEAEEAYAAAINAREASAEAVRVLYKELHPTH
jgi:hypothetical protein